MSDKKIGDIVLMCSVRGSGWNFDGHMDNVLSSFCTVSKVYATSFCVNECVTNDGSGYIFDDIDAIVITRESFYISEYTNGFYIFIDSWENGGYLRSDYKIHRLCGNEGYFKTKKDAQNMIYRILLSFSKKNLTRVAKTWNKKIERLTEDVDIIYDVINQYNVSIDTTLLEFVMSYLNRYSGYSEDSEREDSKDSDVSDVSYLKRLGVVIPKEEVNNKIGSLYYDKNLYKVYLYIDNVIRFTWTKKVNWGY